MEVRLSPPSPNAKLSSLLLYGQGNVHSQCTLFLLRVAQPLG
jgi:hypothetical protein